MNVESDGLYGARLQYNKNQKLILDRLEGSVSAYASGFANTCDLEIGEWSALSAGSVARLWIKNGLRLKIGATRDYPAICYMSNPVSSNSIELADGVFINEIHLPRNSSAPVCLHAGSNCAIGKIMGSGTFVVERGTVRIGRTEAGVKVDVRGGTVTFGGGEDLGALLSLRPALWLDASATNGMVGAWNAGWAASSSTGGGKKVLAHCPAVTFNGASAATWTNGFPLIEKWYDRRPSQRLNYGWQDRCVNYSSTLYTLVYPYLVPDGLNGRAYMSFGEHGGTDLDADVYGLAEAAANVNSRRERRRMPLMQDMYSSSMPEGHAITPATVVVVFGSQQGGGRAVLGGYKFLASDSGGVVKQANGRQDWPADTTHNPACNPWYVRGGTGYGTEESIFADANFVTFVDGDEVDPTQTPLNGGWQVLTFSGKTARAFRSFGMGENYTSAGGQNYAEIIAYTNALSTRERLTVEGYLAQKWNLPGALPIKGAVSVAAGATVKGSVMGVTGAGTWLVDAPDASPTVADAFSGRLALPFTYDDGMIAEPKRLNASASAVTGVVTVDFSEPPRTGRYDLVTGTAVEAFSAWRVETTGAAAGRTYALERSNGVLQLVVRSGGMMVIMR